MSMGDLRFPKFDYYLDESDPDVVVLRRQNGSFVAAFSARGATREGILEAAEEDYRELIRRHAVCLAWRQTRGSQERLESPKTRLIHRSVWKAYSPKTTYSMVHSPACRAAREQGGRQLLRPRLGARRYGSVVADVRRHIQRTRERKPLHPGGQRRPRQEAPRRHADP